MLQKDFCSAIPEKQTFSKSVGNVVKVAVSDITRYFEMKKEAA